MYMNLNCIKCRRDPSVMGQFDQQWFITKDGPVCGKCYTAPFISKNCDNCMHNAPGPNEAKFCEDCYICSNESKQDRFVWNGANFISDVIHELISRDFAQSRKLKKKV